MNEQETKEAPKTEGTAKDNAAGSQSEVDEKIKRINAETARINEAIAANENAKERARLGGLSVSAPQEETKKELTPREYAELVSKGIVPGH